MSHRTSSTFRAERSFHSSSSSSSSSASRALPAQDPPMDKALSMFSEDFSSFMRPHSEPLTFPARPGGPGNIKTLGDAYEFAVDVSDFSPEDIIVTTSNNHIEVRAEKGKLETLLPELASLRAHYCRCRPRLPDPFFRSQGGRGSHGGREGTVEVEGCGQGAPEG
ncbi:heat shock protein beta-7 [Pteropus vampyrus]|uniref:Heat shock protein beta-7 n=1 Tax=Pteropus vampyrus TaxID=132908 RepID=A0A6P3QKL1_PTEVA|nr:heat shock protein beta-7 [Pteropus vampyrus]